MTAPIGCNQTAFNCLNNNGGCQQVCTSRGNNPISCSCYDGYSLNIDNVSCSAVNMCTFLNGGCSQICNYISPGTISCSCNNFYSLTPDNKSCVSNACTNKKGNCGPDSVCNFSVITGKYCTCNTGFTSPSGSGADCTPGLVLAAT